ncbi:hypothetical protein [Acidithiobacillus thiooxidans]|uniref:hypothetical protein n=1 Tax=Acidithiobacillus thiooxidans TaxID=930 RepID=UPI001C06EE62|nr:hypothetical protein [Acidithiobacillus thiooxidans]MBU2842581.1 hypothetical protein [Acidithiobacillus thiooxidans]
MEQEKQGRDADGAGASKSAHGSHHCGKSPSRAPFFLPPHTTTAPPEGRGH